MVYCIGLTGGIGCGKSTVAHAFESLGAAVIDTDAIAHTLTQTDAPGFKEIIRQFGTDFVLPQGALDRAKLRTLVFSDPSAKAKLESILHPMIQAQVQTELNQCRAPYVMIVVPLLFESGHYLPLVQRTVVVDCAESSQITRTIARSHLSESQVLAIMAHQLPRQARLKLADDIIHNDSDLETLCLNIATLHDLYSTLALALVKS